MHPIMYTLISSLLKATSRKRIRPQYHLIHNSRVSRKTANHRPPRRNILSGNIPSSKMLRDKTLSRKIYAPRTGSLKIRKPKNLSRKTLTPIIRSVDRNNTGLTNGP